MMELRPMITDDDNFIIGGNQRYGALKELGYTEVPREWVKKASDLTEEEKKRFIILDNVQFGENDWEMLANEWDLKSLEDWGLDIPGFKTMHPAGDDDFKTPDKLPETVIKLGDVITIGPHRLMCGDARSKEHVTTLTGETKPILMVTDPPYGVNYDPDWRNRSDRANGKPYGASAVGLVKNDDRVDWTLAYSLFGGNVAYVWHAAWFAPITATNLESSGFEIVNQIIWAKNGMVISRGNYHWQHEPCWYAVKKGKNHNWQGDRTQTTVWEIDRPKRSETGHSTQKPVECMARPIMNNTKEGEHIYDPFIGSGTSMVAAEQLGRICLGMEINPQYCQIIVNRMGLLDKSLPVLLNGEPFPV